MKKLLFPNKGIGFFLFNLGFGLLLYVFSCHLEETPIAYISYLLSFYALVIFILWFYKACKFGNEWFKKSKLYHFYQNNFIAVTKTKLYSSLICNFLYGILKLGIGAWYKSWWFITFAVYYLLLCSMKLSLVQTMKKNKNKDLKSEYKKLKLTGIILLFLNIILIGMIVLIIKKEQVIHYNGFLIYLVAMYDFYLIISAIVSVLKYRKNHSPIIASSKCINLTVAMISMVSLEVAMISQFGNNDLHFKLIMASFTGLGICLINSVMAIYMVVRASKYLK